MKRSVHVWVRHDVESPGVMGRIGELGRVRVEGRGGHTGHLSLRDVGRLQRQCNVFHESTFLGSRASRSGAEQISLCCEKPLVEEEDVLFVPNHGD